MSFTCDDKIGQVIEQIFSEAIAELIDCMS